jgi:hypothetical protein
MNFGIDPNQASTHRGAILIVGAAISLLFEWFGKPSGAVMPLFVGLAGAYGFAVKDR